ncbi:predicted protein [Uncinocarpus reesii 1704]|uniref:Uncharacterized protein n=1 Tax=Uncinocarpus reesii (strain UAMH 1704) TaxID=336963 RepID=C4JVB9_UNCRE|nr:uncharacterized protein UREG_06511 [Uncinocarpus reesii 1704]EEP81646.1 predicted protein [Uncinocarpus reesii 1704]
MSRVTVSHFLEEKAKALGSNLDYCRTSQDSLHRACSEKLLSHKEYSEEMLKVDQVSKPVVSELRVLKRQRRTLEHDVQEGPYLEKSTLLSLGRNISGFELPPPIYEGNTFDGDKPDSENEDLALSALLRDAMIAMAKEAEKKSGSEYDESSESDEEE